MLGVDWSYFDKFEAVEDLYLPACGQGETMATQVCTAVCKLVYKWYNDGDVFDNTGTMTGWCNDLSDEANWLDANTDCGDILRRIGDCYTDADYEHLLKDLADYCLCETYLKALDNIPAKGSIYDCDGVFHFEEQTEDEDEYWEDESDWEDDCEDEEDW